MSSKTKPAAVSTFDPSKVKMAKQLVFPVLKLPAGDTVYVKITDALYQGRQIEDQEDSKGNKRGPATLLKVIDLQEADETATAKVIVAPKLLQSTLRENYEADSYVGKFFAITKGESKTKGKNGDYNTFQVIEIEDPANA